MKIAKTCPPMKRRRCHICEDWFIPRRRARKISQRCCSKAACQKERKAENKRDWWRRNPDYDQSRRTKIQDWAKDYPDYWRQYRATHPGYVEKDNRRRVLSRQKSQLSAKQDSVHRRVDGLVDYLLWKEESAKQNPIASALSP